MFRRSHGFEELTEAPIKPDVLADDYVDPKWVHQPYFQAGALPASVVVFEVTIMPYHNHNGDWWMWKVAAGSDTTWINTASGTVRSKREAQWHADQELALAAQLVRDSIDVDNRTVRRKIRLHEVPNR